MILQPPSPSSRRQFLLRFSAAAVGTALAVRGTRAHATPLGLPLGIQLYSVREQLAQDYAGTLKQLAAIGYQEVEAAGFFNHTPQEVRSALAAASLRMPSSHYSATLLQSSFDQQLEYGKALDLQYFICSFPAMKDPARAKDPGNRLAFTLEDYRYNAELFNGWGRRARAAGMQFGYHNHTMEFHELDGTTGFDEMMRLTDPALVTFEMDCGWVSVGGGDPAALLRKYPTRISMLHIKDFKPSASTSIAHPPPPAELGTGTVKFAPIFAAAAKSGHIRHMFVEQEGYDMPAMQALRIDARYMQSIRG